MGTDTPSPGLVRSGLTLTARGKPYVPALGPKMKALLFVIFTFVALLGASGVYLAAITLLNWYKDPQTYTTPFTFWAFILHTGVGLVFLLPFIFFGCYHLSTARKRPNRVAVRLGVLVFLCGLLVCLSGVALIQLEGMPQLPTGSVSRSVAYWAHVGLPVLAIVFYVAHRKAGPPIKWKWGYAWGGAVGVFTIAMLVLHAQDPRKWYAVGPKEGVQYFFPSDARTADGNFIPAQALMMDEYCMKCHADIYNDHLHSAHKFSSFNNPPYLFSVRQTRKVSLERDGDVKASRWCAGCHDPVPFFSGAFDDPKFDDVKHPTAHAGITCVVCHAMTNVNATTGNAAYTIENPQHYPFAFSGDPTLQWINNQLIKAKPDFHKKTFLKPFHKSAGNDKASEFCSTCHKVALPGALNHYKEWLRGQNHYDSFLLSGVSGHGARSFYYPPQAKTNCADCHMPLRASGDFGAKDRDGSGVAKVHHHGFPAANAGLFAVLKDEERYKQLSDGFDKAIKLHTDFLTGTDPEGKDKKLRIDLFGVKTFKPDGTVDDETLVAPLRPELPKLKPGQTYLIEVVIRTLNMGHPFPQGTADSNEIWVDFLAKSGGRVIGRSGALANPDDSGPVDEWSHFVNVLMLSREGKRIDRRNPEDIFTPLYDHQIPPGAALVVHYKLQVPPDAKDPIDLTVRLRYRKFDYAYMEYVHKDKGVPVPKLPIVDLCSDYLVLPVEGGPDLSKQDSPIKPAWQRWNDYGIGCYLEGGVGLKKGELRQAEKAFRKLLELGVKDAAAHAHVNLARVMIDDVGGNRLDEAARELQKAKQADPPAPWWLVSWFNGIVNLQNATDPEHLDAAIADFARIVDRANQPRDRGFDFGRDYVVLARLGDALFNRSKLEEEGSPREREFLLKAIGRYEQALAIDAEDLDSQYGISQCYAALSRQVSSAPALAGVTPEALQDLAGRAADSARPVGDRGEAARQLAQTLVAFGRQPLKPREPKLPVLREALAKLRPAFGAEKDPAVQDALAAALGKLHLQLWAIFKPDDNARDRAWEIYRSKHPAADRAAEAIVIYPTKRPGAPGF
jgi:tetratricopeptide (TPR) repeat protein